MNSPATTQIEFYDPAMDGRKAIVTINSDRHLVIFGRMILIDGVFDFHVAYTKPSKTYKTAAGAHNASVAWVYNR